MLANLLRKSIWLVVLVGLDCFFFGVDSCFRAVCTNCDRLPILMSFTGACPATLRLNRLAVSTASVLAHLVFMVGVLLYVPNQMNAKTVLTTTNFRTCCLTMIRPNYRVFKHITLAPNEKEIGHRWRERALLRTSSFQLPSARYYTGQRFAASPG